MFTLEHFWHDFWTAIQCVSCIAFLSATAFIYTLTVMRMYGW